MSHRLLYVRVLCKSIVFRQVINMAEFSSVETLNAEQRLAEIARVFAQAVVRVHLRGNVPDSAWPTPEIALNSAAQGLEQSAETRLSVTRGSHSESPKVRRA